MKPSEFYRMRRPEYFSDSEIIDNITLSREVLAYELSKISTNQKQDEFETLCRRLAERFITPNLIPQVGPTGGGDGKTDSETHPVSSFVSERWFVPENGWSENEKWAFAISAKEEWKSKAKGDVKKIVETNRDYTHIYFMTNQLVSSKKKKIAQDEFLKEFKVEVSILDGEWILEKIYGNDIIDIVVDSLNLSSVFKSAEKKVGVNDSARLKRLRKIEENILNPNKYLEYDFQLVEDALEAAILSRMLEKPRDEVEGKFARALRLGQKLNNPKQLIKIYYQRAWTALNWYDDYTSFFDDYKKVKEYALVNFNISGIEYYVNLFYLLNGLTHNQACDLSTYNIDKDKERAELINSLRRFEDSKGEICSSLTAKTYRVMIELTLCLYEQENPKEYFQELSNILKDSETYLDYPFEIIKKSIEELGVVVPENNAYDNLIDVLALVSEKRYSELAASQTFLKRAGQKFEAEYYKESIIYFGKSVIKLAKEESKEMMHLALLGLGTAYRELGLIWASNNCFVSACSLSFRSMHENGVPDLKTYQSLEEIIKNELFIGRFPSLFSWYEMLSLLSQMTHLSSDKQKVLSFAELADNCLAVRILYFNESDTHKFEYLPDLLVETDLLLSYAATLYKLGYIDKILNQIDIENENDLDDFFIQLSNSKFYEQILYQSSLVSEDKISLHSKIVGCNLVVRFEKNSQIVLMAETFLAFIEGFLASSIDQFLPSTETIIFNLIQSKNKSSFEYECDTQNHEYNIFINEANFRKQDKQESWNSITKLILDVLAKNFMSKDLEAYILELFQKEEVQERLSLVIDHRDLVTNLLGNKPKLVFSDWENYIQPKQYISRREETISYNYQSKPQDNLTSEDDIKRIRHDQVQVHSAIDNDLWDKAKWNGFGFEFHPERGLFIILTFENIDAGIKIFEQWNNKLEGENSSEQIEITIIKGIDKQNPFWYRVRIGTNIKNKELLQSNKLFVFASKVHEMNPMTSESLDNLIRLLKTGNQYTVCPASISPDRTSINPLFDKRVSKLVVVVKDAWEIGENDPDKVVMRKGDTPIIPNGVSEVPILKVLSQLD